MCRDILPSFSGLMVPSHRVAEDLDHTSLNHKFSFLIWFPFSGAFGVSLASNRNCRARIEVVILFSSFGEKDKFLASLLLCGCLGDLA